MYLVQGEAVLTTLGWPDLKPPQEASLTSLDSVEAVGVWRNYKIFVKDPFFPKPLGLIYVYHVAVLDLTLINWIRWRLWWWVMVTIIKIIQPILT